MLIKLFYTIVIFLIVFTHTPLQAQLRIGYANTGVNFREGPGKDFMVRQTIDTSNLLVVLPREPQIGRAHV